MKNKRGIDKSSRKNTKKEKYIQELTLSKKENS
jgi:hypothetical protein